jgi:hypothetical protein
MKRTKEFSTHRFAWLDQVAADPSLPASAFKLCFYLSQCFNESRDGMAWAGLQWLADAAHLDKSHVRRTIKRLQANGHLEVEPGSRGSGHSNRYWWVIKGDSSPLSGEIKGDSSPQKGDSRPLNPLRTLVQGSRERPHQGCARATPAHEEWIKLCEIWQRPWPDDPKAGQRAFEAACQETTPEMILEAAQAWVAAAEAPQFLQPLTKWLAWRGWEKEPPKRRKARGRNGGKADLAALAFAYGDYAEQQVEEAEPDATIIDVEAVTLLEWHTPTVVELFGEEAARWRDVP